jgi:hypothetical protein
MDANNYDQTQKGTSASFSFKINKQGKIVGPDGKEVSDALGDTPIVISGGSLEILSDADLDDDNHPGQRTKQLHAQDMSKHVSSVQLVGLKPDPANPNRFVPINTAHPVCTIIIHYG